MCGILGIVNFNNNSPDENLVSRMRDTMHHRGPDDAGIYVEGPVALAHRRLSIIDLTESGHQPMTNEDKSLFLVFNGEIYNHIELRKELEKSGHHFFSTSDSEVILHQYEEDGPDCLAKFNGMFSFIIWDTREKRLFAARDRLGIKPLYYFLDDRRVIFSSEIKAIIEDSTVPRDPDYFAVADYMFARRALGNKTMFRHVKEIEPGHMVTVDQRSKHVSVRKYWDVVYNYNYSRTDKDLSEELFWLLDDSIKIHCRSDAPLGCHLSGGIDSSTVTALAARHRDNLQAFSIKFSDDNFVDETSYARAVARHIGGEYIESSPSSRDMARLLPALMWHMDSPMTTDGGFAYYAVSKLAKESVKVTLTGHGGDEIFAGYRAQFEAAFNTTEMFFKYKDPTRITKKYGDKGSLKSLIIRNPSRLFHKLFKKIAKTELSLEDLWINRHCGTGVGQPRNLDDSFVKLLQGYSPRDEYLKPLLEAPTDQILDKCLYHDMRLYLPGLLHMEDRVSMALSIESRVPLLDFRIIELLATVPPEQKVRGLQPKYLLRECASRLLPEEVYSRKDKFAFPVPGKIYFSEDMERMKEKVLLSPQSFDRGIFKPEFIKEACESPKLIWALLNIELWFEIFIDQNDSWRTTVDKVN